MKKILATTLALSLSACASITVGNDQSVSVTTTPKTGATCQLSSDAGTWFVPATPGTVTIERDMSDMTVVCKRDELSGTAVVESSTKSLAFGNILAGGIIGAAVDMGTGSAYDYPALITVPIAEGGMFTNVKPVAPAAPGEEGDEFPDSSKKNRR